MAREWDADAYERLSAPQTRWGEAVVEWLDLAGHERVLDAGCGTGRVTERLLDRLPRGRVVALDGSLAMIERARERLGDERVEYVLADLMEPLPLAQPVDAVLSTAAFHWVPDHSLLFRNLAAALHPGGQLAAQCGGAGNIASLESAVARLGHSFGGDHTFPTVDQTRERLRAAGFVEVDVWLHDEPTPIPPADFEAFLANICLRAFVEGMSPADRDSFVREVAAQMPGPEIDYVRLNIRARRAERAVQR
jgi:trans-aconitate 2-methyltransferase